MRLLRRDAAPVAGVCRQVPAALLGLPGKVVRVGVADPMGQRRSIIRRSGRQTSGQSRMWCALCAWMTQGRPAH